MYLVVIYPYRVYVYSEEMDQKNRQCKGSVIKWQKR